MDLKELIYGLRDIEYSPDLPRGYVDDINRQSKSFRDEIVSKLGLKQTSMLHGGGIELEFDEGVFPEEEILAMDQEKVMMQLGGGLITRVKAFFMTSRFKSFLKTFEKAKADAEAKKEAFAVETNLLNEYAKDKCTATYNLMLNSKVKVMMEIQRDDVKISSVSRERTELITHQLELAELTKKLYEDKIKKYDKDIRSKSYVFTLLGIKFGTSYIDKLKKKVKKDFKTFTSLYSDYLKYELEKSRLDGLAKAYTAYLPKSDKEIDKQLFSRQKTEFKEFKEKQKLYKALKDADLPKLQGASSLSTDIGKMMIAIKDYESAFTKLTVQKKKAEDTIEKWEKLIRETYLLLIKAIDLSREYKGSLDTIKILTEENYNHLKSIAMQGLEAALAEYEFHNDNVGYAQEMMTKLTNTLVAINNKFVNLVPSRNLKEDAFAIAYTRTFIYNMIKQIERRQQLFSKRGDYIQSVLKGGMYMETGVPPYIPHQGALFCVEPGTKETDISTALFNPPIGDIVYMPYGGLFIDDFTGGQQSVKTFFTNYIRDKILLPHQLTTYLPLYNINKNELQIFKYSIPDSDINTSTCEILTVDEKLFGDFIPIEDEYYTINIFSNPKYNSLLTHCTSIGNEFIILPLFYKMYSKTGVIEYDEMHLINPITAQPVLCYFQDIKSPLSRPKAYDHNVFPFELKFESIMHTNRIDTIRQNYKCYYQFNAKGLKYNIGPHHTNIRTLIPDASDADFDFSSNPDFASRHSELLLQLTYLLNTYYKTAVQVPDITTTYAEGSYISVLKDNHSYSKGFEYPEFNILGEDRRANKSVTLLNIDLHYYSNVDNIEFFKYLINWFSKPALPSHETPVTYFGLSGTGGVGASSTGVPSPMLYLQPTKPQVTDKIRMLMEFFTRMTPPENKYWKNLDSLKTEIDKFFTPKYITDFEAAISKITENINEMATMENGILKITVDVPKIELVNYDIVVSNLEVKPVEYQGPQTEEGKSLMESIVKNQAVVSKFEATMNITSDSFGRAIEPLLKAIIGWNQRSPYPAHQWFKTSNDNFKYLEYLRTQTGAQALIDYIEKDETYRKPEIKKSICESIRNTVGASAGSEVYDRYIGSSSQTQTRYQQPYPAYSPYTGYGWTQPGTATTVKDPYATGAATAAYLPPIVGASVVS